MIATTIPFESVIGLKKGIEDTRGTLFYHIAEILKKEGYIAEYNYEKFTTGDKLTLTLKSLKQMYKQFQTKLFLKL